jgi:phosphatidylserine/phosphatidylglycerophosphate/cardiolipin synthase-like enzyme
MAKFLNTRKAVSEIEELIRNAGEKLILISPYLKLSKDFRELLTYRNSKDKVTTIIFGKQELNPDEMKFLQSLRFVVLKFHADLHAKCYMNDDKMIITSLNLYEFSMANNKEMGVLIDRHDLSDQPLFEDANKEIDFISETSQRFELGSNKLNAITLQENKQQAFKHKPKTGYCIRTGVEIPFNPEKPMSYDAFKIWNQFGDADFPEKFCHFSGKSSNGQTSVRYPILKENWKQAQEIYGL